MKTYLVGGAVRDELLGLPVRERDWLVTEATPDDMVAQGFRAVGKDFPVFLHPETQEEYALARTERKSGPGYRGFVVNTAPTVTLEEDLIRRDLTVNAIARDANGNLHDPYGGQRDLQQKILRHVSPAFAEDPVRILRVARFAARFAPLGFTVAEETMTLMRQMVEQGEADHLVPERVWKETERVLGLEKPSTFFFTLLHCGALARVMPELSALHGVPQRADYHPEVDSFVHTLMCVDYAASVNAPLEVRFSALVHDLGKAVTPKEELPSHRMHEFRGLPLVRQFCERLRIPNACRDLALLHTRDHLMVHQAFELRPPTLHDLLNRLEAFKNGGRFEAVLLACLSDARGRTNFENCDYPQNDYLRAAAKAANVLQAKDVVADGFSGPAVADELRARRVAALTAFKASQQMI